MTEAHYQVGETFSVQFVWRVPDGDFLRALFDAEVLYTDQVAGKYVLLLLEFAAARQERTDGSAQEADALSREYWTLVTGLVGRKISVAFEADDARPLWLRLDTLTGEHDFFTRLDDFSGHLRPGENTG